MSENQIKLGMAPNVGGLLCNVPCGIGLLFSIVAVIIERQNRFIRFHALQSLLLHGVAFFCFFAVNVASFAMGMIMGSFGRLIGVLDTPLAVAFLGTQVFMMMKANNNETFKLPVIGEMAARWV